MLHLLVPQIRRSIGDLPLYPRDFRYSNEKPPFFESPQFFLSVFELVNGRNVSVTVAQSINSRSYTATPTLLGMQLSYNFVNVCAKVVTVY